MTSPRTRVNELFNAGGLREHFTLQCAPESVRFRDLTVSAGPRSVLSYVAGGEIAEFLRTPGECAFVLHPAPAAPPEQALNYLWLMRLLIFYLPLLFLFAACQRGARTYDFPTPVDTSTREITLQEKRAWAFPVTGLTFDNQFDGARLNGVVQEATNLYRLRIDPENTPINSSPWYAFRLRADRDKRVTLHLTYGNNARHRYFPKLSAGRETWTPVDSSRVIPDITGKSLYVTLDLKGGQAVYLAGQEVVNSADVMTWAQGLSQHPDLSLTTVGQSKLGRNLLRLDLRSGAPDKRPVIVLFSRQHPPEVTGYLAFQSFIDGLLADPRLGEFLTEYQVLIYPLLNPDGVDLGHWRHTAGGIDSNRDWGYYRQPEAFAVANDVVAYAKNNRARVVLGMDFHSTWKDVYYTHDGTVQPPSALPGFKDAWLAGIERAIGGEFRINEEAEPIGRPTTMSWFRTQFGAEGITYEIGDGTDREFVDRKGRVSARVLLDVLLK